LAVISGLWFFITQEFNRSQGLSSKTDYFGSQKGKKAAFITFFDCLFREWTKKAPVETGAAYQN
jgi:hypothetical protein